MCVDIVSSAQCRQALSTDLAYNDITLTITISSHDVGVLSDFEGVKMTLKLHHCVRIMLQCVTYQHM